MLTSAREGVTSYIEADARNVEGIISAAARTVDFSQPVAVILIGILNFIPGDGAGEIVRALRDAVAPGSYLIIMQPASDLDPLLEIAAHRWNQIAATPVTLRSRAEVTAWADGLETVEPGVVQVTQWWPEEAPAVGIMPLYALVTRKP
jgi:hypothetical protein